MLKVNSKKVEAGDTFLALKSEYHDGHDYINEAIDNGAACIIASKGEYDVKTIITPDTRTYLANYLKELNLEKLERIKLIGIVGSRGKTCTGDLTCQLLNNLNVKTAFIGTNGFYLNGVYNKTKETTPDIYELYEMINQAIDNECEVIVIEISSKAIKQRHIEGIRFDMLVFTNFIAKETSKEEYLNSKIEPFKMLKKNGYAIINKNDNNYSCFALPQNSNIFYGPQDSDYPIIKLSSNYGNIKFNINQEEITIPLTYLNDMYNYAPAYIIAKLLHFNSESIASANLSLHSVEGRFESIKYKDSLIVIDYAYNHDSINNVIEETRALNPSKIITIIGQGGECHKEARPLIGKLVTEKSDYVIFTNDNPRHEDENEIINDITKDLTATNYEVILNRKEAIRKGISMLDVADILLILGKGHEDSQIIDGNAFPFKDKSEVIKAIK